MVKETGRWYCTSFVSQQLQTIFNQCRCQLYSMKVLKIDNCLSCYQIEGLAGACVILDIYMTYYNQNQSLTLFVEMTSTELNFMADSRFQVIKNIRFQYFIVI